MMMCLLMRVVVVVVVVADRLAGDVYEVLGGASLKA